MANEYDPAEDRRRRRSVIESIGELRHRLRFERQESVENENGVPIRSWTPVCTVWGAARDVSGREFYEAAARQMENVTTFTVRWRADLDTSMRIVFRGEPYEIIQINHLGYRGDYMQIKAMLRGGDG